MRTMNNRKIKNILDEFSDECRLLLGEKLAEVRLYGSYARNDNDAESDIDVIILLNVDKSDSMKYLDAICSIASEIDMKYGVFLSPVLQSKSFFDANKTVSGFYRNVEHDGVVCYAQ